ncbi:hypothetical protein J1605_018350 [Eschrichtius robustus]|uniref:Uncharacterized protein n=1 Tax=Eschrichtius robustus TaxID=9764 RepID=A0AB34HX21_ESCRO|nr:hypothetical protein J1605_018350 [Eschrichtius robustus]
MTTDKKRKKKPCKSPPVGATTSRVPARLPFLVLPVDSPADPPALPTLEQREQPTASQPGETPAGERSVKPKDPDVNLGADGKAERLAGAAHARGCCACARLWLAGVSCIEVFVSCARSEAFT